MTEKISKICWNSYKWRKPSGTDGKSPSIDSYENIVGYGHEEWLFDKSRIINGFHYGFLQPLNLKTDRHSGNIYKIWLYTITNREKFLVGFIDNVKCISKDESVDVYKDYKKYGWLKEMLLELESAGINSTNLKETPDTIYFNIKFKIKDINLLDDFLKISNDDINLTTTRYKLLDKIADFTFEELKAKATDSYDRKAISATIIDPYHSKIQNCLAKILTQSKEFKNIKVELKKVDVQATNSLGEKVFFEIKTDTPKNNIRQAIGQLLEYSYYPQVKEADKLIIIGDTIPSNDITNYLQHIRKVTNLNIYYSWIDLEKSKLSKEY